uniref:Uncharacterized protein n=1 Tax=Corethron hystrix TaxID=216773 RepID=A0A7S1B4P3_9STRA
MSHVAYTTDGDPAERCPATHPVRIPIIAFFFRIFNYDGGWHMFSDESGIYHADYVSGWDAKFLQKVLNRCKNDSLGPNPNAFCDDHITFRDGPKCSDDGCDFSDPNLLKKLKQIQPKLHNFRASISPENTASAQGNLPRGTCTGTLLPRAPTAAPQRNPTKAPTPNCKEGKKWKYLVKRKKNSKGKIKRWFKTCGWLRQRSEKYIKNQCKRTSPWDENFGPAKIECPKTCKTCHLVENRQKNEEEFTNYTSYSNAGL